MTTPKQKTLLEIFSGISDPRVARTREHRLIDILVIAVCTAMSGGEGFTDCEEFGKAKYGWLKTFLELPSGIPSHDTFNRVFARLDPEAFRACFLEWVSCVREVVGGEVVALDGKRLRRSGSAWQRALHVVSAWATANRLVLGQVRTEEKSNEITAIPKLLEMLMLQGCIVTIDAMGCQKEIADRIRDKEADYVLSVKGNQGTLLGDLEVFFADAQSRGFAGLPAHREVTGDHGRIETRRCWATDDIDWLRRDHDWIDLKSIALVERTRTIGEKTTVELAYFITSLGPDAEVIANAVRAHWGIENQLHWVLDVSFREDQSRIRTGHAAENMAMVRHLALNLLKRDTSKGSLRAKQKRAGWDTAFLQRVLTI